MIRYMTTLEGIEAHDLGGFFFGWPKPPSPQTHLEILRGSRYVVLALDGQRVVGFITAISDGVLSAYILLLEVLPDCRSQGIGSELMKRLLKMLEQFYMVDVLCDAELLPFYERFGMHRTQGALLRRYGRQSGNDATSRARTPGSGNWQGNVLLADDFDQLPDDLSRSLNGGTVNQSKRSRSANQMHCERQAGNRFPSVLGGQHV
jgi:GNAT superfamily N-acetyltransferase